MPYGMFEPAAPMTVPARAWASAAVSETLGCAMFACNWAMLLATISGCSSDLGGSPITPGTSGNAFIVGDSVATGGGFGGAGGGIATTASSVFMSFCLSFSLTAGSCFWRSSSGRVARASSAIFCAWSSMSFSVFLLGGGPGTLKEPGLPFAALVVAPRGGKGGGFVGITVATAAAFIFAATCAAIIAVEAGSEPVISGICGSGAFFFGCDCWFMGLSSFQGSLNSSSLSSSAVFSPMRNSSLAFCLSFCWRLFSVLSYLNPFPPKPPHRLFF
mmetsp:Transcript_51384/g.143668  ORF Transcript_51384/g.143668 Transcript_51384/m.143668 type:complete len:273 (-) Transcript_51384:690-1508(-)